MPVVKKQTITVQSGMELTVTVKPGLALEFAFDVFNADFTRENDDLSIHFEDGSGLILDGFFNTGSELPMLILDNGMLLPGETFFMLHHPDIDVSTHAAAYLTNMSGGSGDYDDFNGHLLGGLETFSAHDAPETDAPEETTFPWGNEQGASILVSYYQPQLPDLEHSEHSIPDLSDEAGHTQPETSPGIIFFTRTVVPFSDDSDSHQTPDSNLQSSTAHQATGHDTSGDGWTSALPEAHGKYYIPHESSEISTRLAHDEQPHPLSISDLLMTTDNDHQLSDLLASSLSHSALPQGGGTEFQVLFQDLPTQSLEDPLTFLLKIQAA